MLLSEAVLSDSSELKAKVSMLQQSTQEQIEQRVKKIILINKIKKNDSLHTAMLADCLHFSTIVL